MKRIAITLAGALAAFVMAVMPASLALAHEVPDNSSGGSTTSGSSQKDTDDSGEGRHNTTQGSSNKDRENHDGDGTRAESKLRTTSVEDKQEGSKRLDKAKKKICQNRQSNIKTIMSRRVSWAQHHIDLFTTVSERAQKFYAEKGKTLDSYDRLVAAVDSAKAAAQADLDALKTTAAFDCDSDDPKGSITAYKAALEKEKESLKAYRTAVKNLIVGVKSAQGETN